MRKVMKVCFAVFMAVLVLLGNCSFAISINSSARSTYLQLEKNAIKSINNAINSNILFDTNFTTAKEKIEIYRKQKNKNRSITRKHRVKDSSRIAAQNIRCHIKYRLGWIKETE